MILEVGLIIPPYPLAACSGGRCVTQLVSCIFVRDDLLKCSVGEESPTHVAALNVLVHVAPVVTNTALLRWNVFTMDLVVANNQT